MAEVVFSAHLPQGSAEGEKRVLKVFSQISWWLNCTCLCHRSIK